MAAIRSEGVKAMIYIDNLLVVAHTRQNGQKQTSRIVSILQRLGFMINIKKSIMEPSPSLEYLGLIIDTGRMELRLLVSVGRP